VSVFVSGDLIRLTQVVENLLSNAIKYTDPGGQIWLRVEAVGDSTRIVVRDAGIGIEAHLLSDIFRIFFQADQDLRRSKGGLGLGLPLVRALVEMHGGKVNAFSEGLGKGSEFIVTLPRWHEQPHEDATPEQESTKTSRGRRILIVDDEEDAADMLAALLQMQGHEAEAVHDGHTALQMAHTFHPEVVLLDLGLPDIDGYQVARRLRDHARNELLLLVALTGYQRDVRRLQDAGFDEHMLKPPDLDRLAALIEDSAG
jgi:CheY-like chemotaxis protein